MYRFPKNAPPAMVIFEEQAEAALTWEDALIADSFEADAGRGVPLPMTE